MSIQIKKSSLNSYINTNNEILVGSIENNQYASPQQELPLRKGILSATPQGLKLSVEDGDGLLWHEVILQAIPAPDNTFTVRFQAQVAPLGDNQMLAEGSVNTIPVDSTCTCYSKSGLFEPKSADSDGFFEITMDRDAYAAVADLECWRFEWDDGWDAEMSYYCGYIKPQIDMTGPSFQPDNDEYNYVVIDNALPTRRDFIISFYDSVYTQDITDEIALTLTEIYWNPEGAPHAMMEPGSRLIMSYNGESIRWDEGLCPCIEVALPEFLQDYNGNHVSVKCYVKLPLNPNTSAPYEIELDLPGYYGDPVVGEGFDVDYARSIGWIVEYV